MHRIPGANLKTKEGSVGPLVYLLMMMRNRDCLACYLRTRMQRIEEMRWDVAGSLGEDELQLLSVHERRRAHRTWPFPRPSLPGHAPWPPLLVPPASRSLPYPVCPASRARARARVDARAASLVPLFRPRYS